MEDKVLQRAAEMKKEKKFTKRWKRVVAVICAVTVVGTSCALILPAITEPAQAYCGHEEHIHSIEAGCYEEQRILDCPYAEVTHVHSDACYEEWQVISCGLEEGEDHTHSDACFETERMLICGMEEGQPEPHTHTEDCYRTELVLVCDKQEHRHTLACFSNPDADVETADIWEETFRDVELTGEWAEDVAAIAETQLGYTESTRNYTVEADGETTNGYTRYGAWYGDPYGEWDAMFCAFCLDYAGIDQGRMPFAGNCAEWVQALESAELYHEAGNYDPKPGDLVFFGGEESTGAARVGLVYEVSANRLKTIEGSDGEVTRQTYDLTDGGIAGYGELPASACTCGAAAEEPHAADCPLAEEAAEEKDYIYMSLEEEETDADPTEVTAEDGVLTPEPNMFDQPVMASPEEGGRNLSEYISIKDWDLIYYHRMRNGTLYPYGRVTVIENGELVTPRPAGATGFLGDIYFEYNFEFLFTNEFVNQTGDYYEIPLLHFTADDDEDAFLLPDGEQVTPAIFNGVNIGTRTIYYDSETKWLMYRLDLDLDLLSPGWIMTSAGTNGYFWVKQLDGGKHGEITGFTWTQDPIPEPKVEILPKPSPDELDPMSKLLARQDSGVLRWKVCFEEFFVQYAAKENEVANLIFEDILDPYQTFTAYEPGTTFYNRFKKGVDLSADVKMYLINAEGTGFSGYSLAEGASIGKLNFTEKNKKGNLLESLPSDTEEFFLSYPKMYKIVQTEVDGQPVEKLMINLGNLKTSGFRWSELDYSGFFTQSNLIDYRLDVCGLLLRLRDQCQRVVDEHPDAAPTDLITAYDQTLTLEKWMEFVRIYQNSYDYYITDPYITSYTINITSRINAAGRRKNILLPGVDNTARVHYEYEDEYEDHYAHAYAENRWSDSFDAYLRDYSVFIGKYDAVTGEQSFGDRNTRISSPVRAAFEVRDETGNLVTFTQDIFSDYAYDPSGTETRLWNCTANGVLSGLVLTGLPACYGPSYEYSKFYVYEVEASPQYYCFSSDTPVVTFDFSIDAAAQYYGVGNNMRRVLLKKEDAKDHHLLPGAKFELYKQNPQTGDYEKLTGFSSTTVNGQTFTQCTGNGADVLTTNLNGIIDLRGLESGSYYLREVQAPNGHMISARSEYTYFTLSDDAQQDGLTPSTDNGPDYKELIVQNVPEQETATLTVTKNVTFGNVEEAFPFVVTLRNVNGDPVRLPKGDHTPDGSVTYTVSEDGEITFNLMHGDCVILENIPVNTLAYVAEISHDGYTTYVTEGSIEISNSDQVTDFEIDTDRTITYHNNNGTVLPDTGGIGTWTVYALSAVLFAGTLYGCNLRRKRERRNE